MESDSVFEFHFISQELMVRWNLIHHWPRREGDRRGKKQGN